MGEKYSCPELATKLNQGTSIEDALNQLWEERLNTVEQQQTKYQNWLRSKIKRFSFTRALNALANPSDRAAQEAAAYEREVSEAIKTYGKPASGILYPTKCYLEI